MSLKVSIGLMAILMLSFGSCKRSNDLADGNGGAVVNVKIDGVSFIEDDIDFEKKSSTNASMASGVVKDTTINYDDFVVDVVMERENSRSNKVVSNSTVHRAANENAAASVVKYTPLTKGVKYKLVVYDENGAYKTSKDYVYGSNPANDTISLDAGKKYTFVAYSVNSTTDLPAISYNNSASTFSNASLPNVSQDLMVYVEKNKAITFGNNPLSIVLKHKFSMITTKLSMDSKMTGSIQTLTNTTIGKVDANASFKFDGETINYNKDQNTYSKINFPTLGNIGLREVTSDPTLVINPATTTKTLTFGTITIDDETKTNFSIENIRINPGCKYNLNLNFRTCTQEVKLDDNALNWKYRENSNQTGCVDPVTGTTYKNGTLLTKIINAPATNYGFTFDMTELDNAINMEVNGKQILTDPVEQQVQFESYNNSANGQGIITRNIKFADGSEHGVGVPNIWTLKGETATPIIRIIISKTGEVTMLGSKTSNGPLFQLVLKGSLKFNKVTWNTSETNTIKITQKVSNTTFVVGRGYGQAKIKCPTS